MQTAHILLEESDEGRREGEKDQLREKQNEIRRDGDWGQTRGITI